MIHKGARLQCCFLAPFGSSPVKPTWLDLFNSENSIKAGQPTHDWMEHKVHKYKQQKLTNKSKVDYISVVTTVMIAIGHIGADIMNAITV